MRRPSLLTLRRGSIRRGSLRRTSLVPSSTSLDLPWDILDRLLLPLIFCHAAAIILSRILNTLRISDVSCLALFAWFSLSTCGAILFYHHLQVCMRSLSLIHFRYVSKFVHNMHCIDLNYCSSSYQVCEVFLRIREHSVAGLSRSFFFISKYKI